jgi:hypothetical protein
MSSKLYILTVFLILGFIFAPSNSYACGSKEVKTENKCCKEQNSNKKTAKSCCNSSSTDDENNSCKGKCGNSNCTTTASIGFSLFVYNEIDFINNNFNFSTNKSKFHHSESVLSDGYTSIWLIPKIS